MLSTDIVMDRFSLEELVDLALCTPEVGAVNFNILRILLREMLRLMGLNEAPAYVNDIEAAQINNFKNYIQGQGTQSPIPGVVNLNSVGTHIGDRGATYHRLPSKVLKQPFSAREPLQQAPQQYPPGQWQQQAQAGPVPGTGTPPAPPPQMPMNQYAQQQSPRVNNASQTTAPGQFPQGGKQQQPSMATKGQMTSPRLPSIQQQPSVQQQKGPVQGQQGQQVQVMPAGQQPNQQQGQQPQGQSTPPYQQKGQQTPPTSPRSDQGQRMQQQGRPNQQAMQQGPGNLQQGQTRPQQNQQSQPMQQGAGQQQFPQGQPPQQLPGQAGQQQYQQGPNSQQQGPPPQPQSQQQPAQQQYPNQQQGIPVQPQSGAQQNQQPLQNQQKIQTNPPKQQMPNQQPMVQNQGGQQGSQQKPQTQSTGQSPAGSPRPDQRQQMNPAQGQQAPGQTSPGSQAGQSQKGQQSAQTAPAMVNTGTQGQSQFQQGPQPQQQLQPGQQAQQQWQGQPQYQQGPPGQQAQPQQQWQGQAPMQSQGPQGQAPNQWQGPPGQVPNQWQGQPGQQQNQWQGQPPMQAQSPGVQQQQQGGNAQFKQGPGQAVSGQPSMQQGQAGQWQGQPPNQQMMQGQQPTQYQGQPRYTQVPQLAQPQRLPGPQQVRPQYTGQRPVMSTAGAQTAPVIIKDGVKTQSGQNTQGTQFGPVKNQQTGAPWSGFQAPPGSAFGPDVTQTAPSTASSVQGSKYPSMAQSKGQPSQRASAVSQQSRSRPRSEDSDMDRPRSDSTSSTPRAAPHMSTKKLEEKVARLERHLEALYALPANPDLLEMEDAHGMTVSDMWQVIQLNNRVAAAEAAIQKIASLIEDLAKQMKGLRLNYEQNIQNVYDIKNQFDPMNQQMQDMQAIMDKAQQDLAYAKDKMRRDLEKLAKAAGVTLSRVPSFMDGMGPGGMGPGGPGTGGSISGGGKGSTWGPGGPGGSGPGGKRKTLADKSWSENLKDGQIQLDANGNPILGADGKPILSQPTKIALGPDGRPILGPNGKPLTNNLIQEYVLPNKTKMMGKDGNPMPERKSQFLMEKNGSFKRGPGNKMLYTEQGELALGPDGQPILSPEGSPVYIRPGTPLKGPDGKPLYGMDGAPLMVTLGPAETPLQDRKTSQPLTRDDGQPLMSDEVFLGPDGKFHPGPDGKPIPIQTPEGMVQLGPDGYPIIGEDGKPVYSRDGTFLLGSDGKPLLGADKQPLTNAIGVLLAGPDGEPLVGPSGMPFVAPNGEPMYLKSAQILLDSNGTPMLGPNNEFLYATLGEVKFDEMGNIMFNPDGTPKYTNKGQTLLGPDGMPIHIADPGLAYAGMGQGVIKLDENGEPVYAGKGTTMVGPDGQPLLGPDGNPLGNNLGQLILDSLGNPWIGPNGDQMYASMGQIHLDSTDMPLLGPDGRMLYSNHGQLMLKPDGTPILGPDGKPGYANQGRPVIGPDGTEVIGADGLPIVLQSRPQKPAEPLKNADGSPLLGPDGEPIMSNQVLLGPNGLPVRDRKGNPIPLVDGTGATIMLGPNGKPLLNSDGTVKYSTAGDTIFGPGGQPLLDPYGQPLKANMGQIALGPDGQPIRNPDGSILYTNLGHMVLDPQGKPVLGFDGKPRYQNIAQIMIGDDGRPLYSPSGKPLYSAVDTVSLGPDGKLTYSMFNDIKNAYDATRGPQAELGGLTPEECLEKPELCQAMQQTDAVQKTLYDEDNCPLVVGMVDEDLCRQVAKGGTFLDIEMQKAALDQDMARRYCELQGMQRQIANDIQDKMEAMYNKLLREIANQQITTSPYMALGPGLGRCMGPGICSGHGMPAGTAVCQFPALNEGSRMAATVGASAPCPYCHGSGRNPCGPCRYCQGTGLFKDRQDRFAGGACVASDTSIFPGASRAVSPRPPGGKVGGLQYGPDASGPCRHGLTEYKICPGGQICPGQSVCPACKDDNLRNLKAPRLRTDLRSQAASEMGLANGDKDPDEQLMEILKKECRTMILLPKDLDTLRARVRREGKIPNVFDEMDVLERLHTLWEAVIALKHNDEALAVRVIKMDGQLKCMPKAAVTEKLQKIPLENLDAIAKANVNKPILIPSSMSIAQPQTDDEECDLMPLENKGAESSTHRKSKKYKLGASDMNPVMSNITNLLSESAQQKDKLDEIYDLVKNLEQSMVTKHVLMDAMSEKADKEDILSKVSYEEFGNNMDDMNSRIQNLVIEVYQKNENWKNVTDHLGEELSGKLDKVELAPIRAYFKSHLKAVEDRLNSLIRQLDEPDPAGTRKKLLKDYNCISCDRHTNISGVTNSPQLPLFGPILAGHGTASQRAYDLHRLRQQKMCRDPDCRDMNLVYKDLQAGGGDRGCTAYYGSVNPSEVAHLVNRYVGGSHTCMSAADRIAAMHRRSKCEYSTAPPGDQNGPTGGGPSSTPKKSSMMQQPGMAMPPDFQYATADVFDE